MSLRSIFSRRSKATAVAAFALLATTVAGMTATGTAQASATASTAPSVTRLLDGSGTVDDPWVPVRPATIICQSATQFGNYSPGSGHSTPINTLYYGYQIGVRYETSDHYSVMAKYSDAVTHWGFILRSCIQYN
jgi:hypothetical protein